MKRNRQEPKRDMVRTVSKSSKFNWKAEFKPPSSTSSDTLEIRSLYQKPFHVSEDGPGAFLHAGTWWSGYRVRSILSIDFMAVAVSSSAVPCAHATEAVHRFKREQPATLRVWAVSIPSTP